MIMGSRDVRFKRFLIGNDNRFLGVVGIVAVVGFVLPIILAHTLVTMDAFLLALPIYIVYFVISVAVSFDRGGLLESFILLMGPQFGYYVNRCSYGFGIERSLSISDLLLYCSGPSPLPLTAITLPAMIALALSIVSVGLGRLLRNQITTLRPE
jgi:hypothetical protein